MVLIPSHSSLADSTLTHGCPAGAAAQGPDPSADLEAEGQKISQGVPCVIRHTYNLIVFLWIEHIKSFLDVVGFVRAIVDGGVCWWLSADMTSLWCPMFISSDEPNSTTSLQSLWAPGRLSYTTSQHDFFLSLTCCFLVIFSLSTPFTFRARADFFLYYSLN